jgi:hypothetical protein
MTAADDGRAAVYAAEIAAFEGTSYETLVAFDQLTALAQLITSAGWWPRGEVPVVRARSDSGTSSASQRGAHRPTVRLAAPQMTPATLIHELAHVLAGVGSGHGPVFRRAHVDLAGYAFGDTEAAWLLDAYAAMQLAPGQRAWAQPHVRGGYAGPLAL